MGRELLAYSEFRTSLTNADHYLTFLGCKWSLLGRLPCCLPSPYLQPVDELQKDESSSSIHKSFMSQIMCTAIQIALVDQLRKFSIIPNAVLGHSSGEIAAA